MLKKEYVAKLHSHLEEMRKNGDLTVVATPRYERDTKAVNKPTKMSLLSRLTGKTGKPSTHWDE